MFSENIKLPEIISNLEISKRRKNIIKISLKKLKITMTLSKSGIVLMRSLAPEKISLQLNS